jgi:hypothetical protein
MGLHPVADEFVARRQAERRSVEPIELDARKPLFE